jgi:pyrroloquinoline quinone biosynthesis protein D
MQAGDRPQRDERIVWRRGDEGVVVLNPNDGQYFSLDDVGGRIWELCEGDRSIAEIADVLSTEYEADASVIQADALELLQELKDEGLVTLR